MLDCIKLIYTVEHIHNNRRQNIRQKRRLHATDDLKVAFRYAAHAWFRGQREGRYGMVWYGMVWYCYVICESTQANNIKLKNLLMTISLMI